MKLNKTSHWIRHGATKNDHEYLEPMITAAEYVEDYGVDERIRVVTENIEQKEKVWWYKHNQKIPNIEISQKTHKEFGYTLK
tara:strand:- start:447 stop:692 length:246 start_codon:yes stop_codon:yes gene_type:complete